MTNPIPDAAASLTTENLQQVIDRRVMIEMAKGIIAHTQGITTDSAWDAIRDYSRAQETQILPICVGIVQAHNLLARVNAVSSSHELRRTSRRNPTPVMVKS
jgi:hypothetical protein